MKLNGFLTNFSLFAPYYFYNPNFIRHITNFSARFSSIFAFPFPPIGQQFKNIE